DGSGIRTHPASIRPSTINSGPRNSPQALPVTSAAHLPPNPAMKPRKTWVRIMPRINMAPKSRAWLLSRPLVTYASDTGMEASATGLKLNTRPARNAMPRHCLAQREKIEAAFGAELDWQELPGRVGTGICKALEGRG